MNYSGFDTTLDLTDQAKSLSDKVAAVGRYLSVNKWKVVDVDEARAIGRAGLDLWVVYQDGNDKISSFDAEAGRQAVTNALEQAKALGQPKGSGIYFAVDFDADPTELSGAIAAYFEAIAQGMAAAGNPYRVGVYGSGATCAYLLERNLVKLAWLCMSTGYRRYKEFYNSKRWNLVQRKVETISGVKGDTNDFNPELPDFGQFKVAGSASLAKSEVEKVVDPDVPTETQMGAIAAYPGSVLAEGQFSSANVRLIQARLNELLNANLLVDGDFGEATADAVRLFQARFEGLDGEALEVDGEVGPKTWSALFGRETVYDRVLTKSSGDLRSQVIRTASSQVGVLEQPAGTNRGPMVDIYIRAAGLNPKSGSYPWCVCFIQWVFDEASELNGSKSPLPKTAGVHALWQMRSRGAKTIVDAHDASASTVRAGMIFLVDTGGGKGHAGIVEAITGDMLTTIEGNTNNGGSREGVGVFRRKSRKIAMKGLLGYLDFCD